MQPSIVTLRDLGAADSALFETETHGALVEEAREVEKNRQERRKEEEEAAMQKILQQGGAKEHAVPSSPGQGPSRNFLGMHIPPLGLQNEEVGKDERAQEAKGLAQQAHSKMSHAMNALLERGEKIDELGKKTTDLEEGAGEYKDLAAQLRAKLEKQNKSALNIFGGWRK